MVWRGGTVATQASRYQQEMREPEKGSSADI